MRVRTDVVMMMVVIGLASGCGGPTDPSDILKTYGSIWINASWIGGRTGSPLDSKTVIPPDFSGSYCPPSSIILENHSHRYESVFSWSDQTLVFKNNCSAAIELLVCETAGSGSDSEFPVCNTDPRTTPLSRFEIISLGAGNEGTSSMTWRSTGLNLDLNLFYCAVDDVFAAGVIAGANASDCLKSTQAASSR